MKWAVVSPQNLEDQGDDDCPGAYSIVVVGACHAHRRAVKAWSEGRSIDGTAAVMDADTLRRTWSQIFAGITTPVVGLQRASA